jgi:dolichyl-phosphate-mannose--protein O-mannosyl transferase
MTYEHIGQSYGSVATLPLRLFPAIMGFLLPLLVYVLFRQLGAGSAAAFFGAALIILDNSLTIQTRIIALDGLLLVSTVGSLVAYFAAKKRERSTWALVKYEDRLSRWRDLFGRIDFKKEGWLFVLAGGVTGLAVGTKFTGLLAGGLLFVLFLAWLVQVQNYLEVRRVAAASILVIVGAAFVYFLGWAVHFMLLTEPGSGDLWRKPQWEQPIMTSFWRETKEIQKIMYDANSGLTAEHHDASPWWSWPMVRTPVFYWQYSDDVGANGRAGAIYFIANPVLWWGATLFLLVILLTLLVEGLKWVAYLGNTTFKPKKLWQKIQSDWRGSFLERAWLPILGYFAAYIPLMRVTRVLFLYHYLTPFLFSLLIVVLWLDYMGWIRPVSILRQTRIYWVVLGVVGTSFLFFTPFTYGLLMPEEIRKWWFWFSTWQ